MVFRRVNGATGIIGALGLCLLALGGLGTLNASPASALGTPSLISATKAFPGSGTPVATEIISNGATNTPSAGTRTYVVEPGDTLWSIAIKFYGNGTKYPLIQRANNLSGTARLQTGSVLIIPSLEPEKTPSPQESISAPIPPFPSLTMLPPTSTALPSSLFPNPTVAPATPVSTSASVSNAVDSRFTPFIPVLAMVMNILAVICFLGSVICAFLSYDLYRRSRHYARRRYIGNRVRAGL